MVQCYHCGKSTQFGRSYTHRKGVAGGRWKKRAPATRRIFRVNLQPVRIILENGKIKRVKICSKCLKRIKKDLREGRKPFLKLAYEEKYLTQKTEETEETQENAQTTAAAAA